MLKIRLRRMGAKHRPFFRIVVSDGRRTPTGPFKEILGTYDPGKDPSELRLDVSRAEEWISKGAHPSETVGRLLERARKETPASA